MNEILQNNLNEALVFLLNTFKEGKSFVLKNAPTFVQQLVAYERVSSLAMFLVSIILIVLGIWFYYHLYKKMQNSNYYYSDNGLDIILSVFLGVGLVAGMTLFFTSIFELIKVYSAPTVFIFEKVSALIK